MVAMRQTSQGDQQGICEDTDASSNSEQPAKGHNANSPPATIQKRLPSLTKAEERREPN